MKILNLYAGIGGNRKLWGDEHEITAVEIDPKVAEEYKKNFPKDKVIIGDAHKYLIKHFEEFEFIWSSPPCQTHSRMNIGTRHKLRRYADLNLYQEIIFLTHFFKGNWIVENVTPYYKPLIPAQKIDRHLFWSSFKIPQIEVKKPKKFILARKKELMAWLGIYLEKNLYINGSHDEVQILRNCVHPKIGKHILNCANKKLFL